MHFFYFLLVVLFSPLSHGLELPESLDASFQEETIRWMEVWLPALGKHDFQIQKGVKKVTGSELRLILDFKPDRKGLEVGWDLAHSPLALEPFQKLLGTGQKLEPFEGDTVSPDYAGCARLLNVFTPKCDLPLHADEILPVEKTSHGQVLLARMYLNHVLANHASAPLSLMPLLARGVAHWVLAETLSRKEEKELIVLRHQIGRMLDPAILPLKPCEEEECRQIDAMAGIPQENRPPELRFLREYPPTADLLPEKLEGNLNRLKATLEVAMDMDLMRLHRRPLWREELSQTQRILNDILLKKVSTPLQALNRLLDLSRQKRPDFIESEKRRIRRFAPNLYARLAYNAVAEWEYQRYRALSEQDYLPLEALVTQKITREYTGAFHSWIQRDLIPLLASEGAYETCRRDWDLCSFEWLSQAFDELDPDIAEDEIFRREIEARLSPVMTARRDQQPDRVILGYTFDAKKDALGDVRSLQNTAMLGRRLGYDRRFENYVFWLDPEQFDVRDSLDRAFQSREEACNFAWLYHRQGQSGRALNLVLNFPARNPNEEVCYAYVLHEAVGGSESEASFRRALEADDSAGVRGIRGNLAAMEIYEKRFPEALAYLQVSWGEKEYRNLMATSYFLQEMDEPALAAAMSVHNLCQSQDEQFADSVLEWSESELSRKDLIRLMKAHCPVFSAEKSPEVSGWSYWDGEKNRTAYACNGKGVVSAAEVWQRCQKDSEFILDLGQQKLNFSDRESFYDYLLQTEPPYGEVLRKEGASDPVFLVEAGQILPVSGYRVLHSGQVRLEEGLGVAFLPGLYAGALEALLKSPSEEER